METSDEGRTPAGISEEELVAWARSAPPGDTRAFEELVRLYQRRIVANCRQITQGNDAEDLAQEVFVKVYFALRKFEGRSTFNHWIRRIKVNHCLNYLEALDPWKPLDAVAEELEAHENLRVAPVAITRLEQADQHRRIGAILDALPSTMRLPLIMRDMDGFSYEDVASALGIGLSAVKMRIKRAREEFRRLYGTQS